MPSPFVFLELTTPDVEKAKDFYGQLCGWTFNDVPMPPPIMFVVGRELPRTILAGLRFFPALCSSLEQLSQQAQSLVQRDN
jgi:catechol 2,3-dioxygenase-like lactoylglutathione lyase family enzyme